MFGTVSSVNFITKVVHTFRENNTTYCQYIPRLSLFSKRIHQQCSKTPKQLFAKFFAKLESPYLHEPCFLALQIPEPPVRDSVRRGLILG